MSLNSVFKKICFYLRLTQYHELKINDNFIFPPNLPYSRTYFVFLKIYCLSNIKQGNHVRIARGSYTKKRLNPVKISHWKLKNPSKYLVFKNLCDGGHVPADSKLEKNEQLNSWLNERWKKLRKEAAKTMWHKIRPENWPKCCAFSPVKSVSIFRHKSQEKCEVIKR